MNTTNAYFDLNDYVCPELLDQLYEDARLYACELVGPNSPEFEATWEREYERLCDEYT